MSINLTGPTAAVTTTDSKISAGTYTFVADQANDLRTKVFAVSAIGGTQTGVQKHTAEAPKQLMFRRPASYAQLGGYNQVSGKYSKVPKNVTRIIGKGSAQVVLNQWEIIPMTLDIGIPAGSASYDAANVEASVMMFITGLYDQKEELCQAIIDGLY